MKNVALNNGFTFGPDNVALIDTVPMQSHTNDPEEEWLPVLSLGIRNITDSSVSGADKLSKELGGEFVDLRRALFIIDDPTNARLLAKVYTVFQSYL